jgi:hypothetical protein
MTIKQQGGVFGRHPEFGTVGVNGLTTTKSLTIQSDEPILKISDELSGSVYSNEIFQSGFSCYYDQMGLGNHFFRIGRDPALTVRYDKDVVVDAGNLVIGTSGKGIDFSATSGTGTSELFDDYEEGTWTPNQGAGLTVSGTFSSAGLYTRIGRQVNVTGKVTGSTNINSSVSGVICTNLPFVVLAASNSVGVMTNTATNNTNMYVNPGTSTAYSSEAAGVSGSLYFSVTYYAT